MARATPAIVPELRYDAADPEEAEADEEGGTAEASQEAASAPLTADHHAMSIDATLGPEDEQDLSADVIYEVGYEEAQVQEADYSLMTPQHIQRGSNAAGAAPAGGVTERLFGPTVSTAPRSALSSRAARPAQKVRISGLHVTSAAAAPTPAAASSMLPPDDPTLLPPEPNQLLQQPEKPTGVTVGLAPRLNPANDVPQFGTLGVYAALVGAQACWSGFHLFAKIAFDYMHPMVLPMIRALGTTPVMFAICYSQDRNFWRLERRDLIQIAILGFLVCCCCQNLFNLGLMLTSAADGGITQPAVPVFAALMSIMLKREAASYIKFAGITCAILGTVCIVVGETYLIPSAELDDQSALTSGQGGSATADANHNVTPGRRLVGIGCFMLQCFLFAVYLLVQKPVLARVPTITITFYTFLFGIPWTTVVAAYFTTQMDWTALPPMWFVSMIYTIAMASVAGFLLFSYATKHLPASTASMGVTLQPLFSSLLGSIFLGEVLTYMHVLGGVFLICGMSLVVYSRVREARKEKYAKEFAAMREQVRRDEEEMPAEEIQLESAAPDEGRESQTSSRRDSVDSQSSGTSSSADPNVHDALMPLATVNSSSSSSAQVDLTPRSRLEQAKVEYRGEIAASSGGPMPVKALRPRNGADAINPTKAPAANPGAAGGAGALALALPPELDFNPARIQVDDSAATGSTKRRASQQQLRSAETVVKQIGRQVQSRLTKKPMAKEQPDHPVFGPQEEDPFQ